MLIIFRYHVGQSHSHLSTHSFNKPIKYWNGPGSGAAATNQTGRILPYRAYLGTDRRRIREMSKQQGTWTSSEVEKNKAVDATIGTAVSYEDLLKAGPFRNPKERSRGGTFQAEEKYKGPDLGHFQRRDARTRALG